MKKNNFLLLVLLSVVLCFPSCGDEETGGTTPEDITIFPGQGLNDLEIGDLGSEVATELGEGYLPVINVGGSGNATYNYFNVAKGVDVIFGQHGSGDLDINTLPIQSFSLSDNFDGMTAEGIKLGSTEAEVIAAYGEPDEIDFWAHVYYIGLIFSYDDMNLVQSITVLEI